MQSKGKRPHGTMPPWIAELEAEVKLASLPWLGHADDFDKWERDLPDTVRRIAEMEA